MAEVVAKCGYHSEGPPEEALIRKGESNQGRSGGNLPVGRTWGQNTRARAALAWQAVFPHSHGNRSDSLWLGCFLSLFLNAAPVCSGEHFSSPYGGLPLAGPWGDP